MLCPCCGREIITPEGKNIVIACPHCTFLVDETYKEHIDVYEDFIELNAYTPLPNTEKAKNVIFSVNDQEVCVPILIYVLDGAIILISIKRKDFAVKRNLFGNYFPSEVITILGMDEIEFINTFDGVCSIKMKNGKNYAFADIYDEDVYHDMTERR